MRKELIVLMLSILCGTLMAQPQYNPTGFGHPSTTVTLVLTAAQDETFLVYVDGDPVNRMPMRQVNVPNLSRNDHDVYVLLKRPEEKITMMNFVPRFPREEFQVSYNQQSHQVEILFTTSPTTPGPLSPVASDDDFNRFVNRMKNEPFDDEKLNLAQGFVAHTFVNCQQICRMMNALSFDDAKVKLLKFAYAYCVDPQNYYTCIDKLSFSSNKKEVMDYIQRN